MMRFLAKHAEQWAKHAAQWAKHAEARWTMSEARWTMSEARWTMSELSTKCVLSFYLKLHSFSKTKSYTNYKKKYKAKDYAAFSKSNLVKTN